MSVKKKLLVGALALGGVVPVLGRTHAATFANGYREGVEHGALLGFMQGREQGFAEGHEDGHRCAAESGEQKDPGSGGYN